MNAEWRRRRAARATRRRALPSSTSPGGGREEEEVDAETDARGRTGGGGTRDEKTGRGAGGVSGSGGDAK